MKTPSVLLLVISLLVAACSTVASSSYPLRYKNAEYGFTVSLPNDWYGFSTVTATWKGWDAADVVTERGPLIILRNPRWAIQAPYQDIPIKVFTIKQWDRMNQSQGGFSTAAGGVEYEFFRNSEYVFSVHSRFNADDSPKGWREATDMVQHLIDQHFASRE